MTPSAHVGTFTAVYHHPHPLELDVDVSTCCEPDVPCPYPPQVRISLEGLEGEDYLALMPDEARGLAGQLVEAADRLDAVTVPRTETWYFSCRDCTENWEAERPKGADWPAMACPVCGSLYAGNTEPPGSGDDPYGRPDPRTHPEAWCE